MMKYYDHTVNFSLTAFRQNEGIQPTLFIRTLSEKELRQFVHTRHLRNSYKEAG